MQKGAPVYVKIEEYRDVLDIITLLKDKISEANGILDKINELKSKEDSELNHWQKGIDEIEKKISSIDKMLVSVK